MTVRWLTVAVFLVGAGCTGLPDSVTDRPNLPACAQEEDIFLPPGQGPGDDAEAALMAIDCVTSASEAGKLAELDFTLMGTEGERYRAIVQVLGTSNIDYFREFDSGWGIYEDCRDIAFPEPGIPEPIECESITLP